VLGVDGVVLDGGVEPQPVALLAVVEGALELARGALAPAAATAAAAAALARGVLVLVFVVVLVVVVLVGLGGGRGFGRAALLLLGAGGLGGLELGGDQRVVLGAQVDLVVEVAAAGPRNGAPSVSPSGTRSFSLLNASICWTVTSS
jgi:hypothetical protein